MRSPGFRPPLSPEHHGQAIVHLQIWSEDHEARLAKLEACAAQVKRWSERAAWAAAMGALLLANMTKEQVLDLIASLLVKLAGG